MDLSRYRKAVVAVVGAGVIVASQLGVAVGPDVEPALVGAFDALVAVLTAVGVERVPND